MPEESFAAIDLGSNSFHMLVARYHDGRLQIIDRMKEMVRLAGGLDKNMNLDQDSMDLAIQCLQRFGQRIREIPDVNVRVVGTNTLRQARNGKALLTRARKALGHPIEIVSGQEEARLIYVGVANTVYHETEQRLVVDIGGGSTEVIIGRGLEPLLLESLYVGCVSMSRQFFPDGVIQAKKMRRAILSARQELEAIEATYRKTGWDAALGSSGTIATINEVIAANGWGTGGISAESLNRLRGELIAAGHIDNFHMQGLPERRRPVFAGGVAVLCGVFEAFGIKHMTVSEGALREGLLYDLIGRLHNRDIRGHTVAEVVRRYRIDTAQARRVENTAMVLHEQVGRDWGLSEQDDLKLLQWSARLHEIGLFVAHAQYHRHGAYLLTYSDLPGFSRSEQVMLAVLVRLHRRKIVPVEIEQIAEEDREKVLRLCLLLRLAVVLNRSRNEAVLPGLKATAKAKHLRLEFLRNWLREHPLTVADLENEKDYLQAVGLTLEFGEG